MEWCIEHFENTTNMSSEDSGEASSKSLTEATEVVKKLLNSKAHYVVRFSLKC